MFHGMRRNGNGPKECSAAKTGPPEGTSLATGGNPGLRLERSAAHEPVTIVRTPRPRPMVAHEPGEGLGMQSLCPELRSEAYRATTLDSELTEATRRFVSDSSKNRFDVASRTLRLSSIFDWFREDFELSSQTLPAFVARFAEPTTATALSSGGNVRVEFLDYDWSLNGR